MKIPMVYREIYILLIEKGSINFFVMSRQANSIIYGKDKETLPAFS